VTSSLDMVRVAHAQRRLARAFLLVLASWGVPFIAIVAAFWSVPPGYSSFSPGLIFWPVVAVCVTSHLFAAIAMHGMLHALGENGIDPWPGTLASALPFINLLVIPVLSADALRPLRRRGIRIGPLGLSSEQLLLLPTDCCPECWYDMSGVPGSICPECGITMSRRATVSPDRAQQ
jgi:hypothetical protein